MHSLFPTRSCLRQRKAAASHTISHYFPSGWIQLMDLLYNFVLFILSVVETFQVIKASRRLLRSFRKSVTNLCEMQQRRVFDLRAVTARSCKPLRLTSAQRFLTASKTALYSPNLDLYNEACILNLFSTHNDYYPQPYPHQPC